MSPIWWAGTLSVMDDHPIYLGPRERLRARILNEHLEIASRRRRLPACSMSGSARCPACWRATAGTRSDA